MSIRVAELHYLDHYYYSINKKLGFLYICFIVSETFRLYMLMYFTKLEAFFIVLICVNSHSKTPTHTPTDPLCTHIYPHTE